MKLLFVCTLFLFVVFVGQTQAQQCRELGSDAERILREVLRVSAANMKPPGDLQEFDDYCSSGKQGLSFMKAYSKCLSGLPRQVFSILTRNVRKIVKQYCESDSGKEVALRHLACFDPPHIEKYQKCLLRYSASLRYSSRANQTELIPSMCCGFYTMEQCIVDTFSDNGGCSKTDPSLRMAKFSREFILLIFGDVFELICGNYNSLDNCNKFVPHVVDSLEKYTRSTNVQHRNVHFVKYLVRLSQRISSN